MTNPALSTSKEDITDSGESNGKVRHSEEPIDGNNRLTFSFRLKKSQSFRILQFH